MEIEPHAMPSRNAPAHGSRLLAELDAALQRPTEGEGVPVGASVAADIAAEELADATQIAKGAAAVVDAAGNSAVLYFDDPTARTLRGKLERYSDASHLTKKGAPRHNPLVAPIDAFRAPNLADLAGDWDIETALAGGVRVWLELWTPGGRLGKTSSHARIVGSVSEFILDDGQAERFERFEATEHDIWLAHLTPQAVRRIPSDLRSVTSIHEPAQARLAREAREVVGLTVETNQIEAPDASSPCIAVLDTGIAEDHPLLAPALAAPGVSVVPGITSAYDAFPGGHGTGMAGIVAYNDLASAILAGSARARSRITNVRLWSTDEATLWALRTEQAVEAAEALAPTTAHLMCLSTGARPATRRTSWGFAIDRLAYNEGNGRLICIACGNVDCEPDPDAYPATNLAAELHDPAHAVNAISVGGVTNLDGLAPPNAHLQPAANAGELSPYTTTGIVTGPIKPDLVMEAGNACPDGALANSGLEELSTLTTSSRHSLGRLLESDSGTSTAASSLAGLIADVADANPLRRPETLRALAINSARWPEPLRAQLGTRQELLRCTGYGIPDVERARQSIRSRATLIHEGEMAPYSAAMKLEDLHLFRLPLASEALLQLGAAPVELAITLSYFVEPHETRRTQFAAGAWLTWDLQRQNESDRDFLSRINARDRDANAPPAAVDEWQWQVGVQPRRRGSVQSDRLTRDAASLAGDYLIAVFPSGGWWRDRPRDRAGRSMPYTLVATIDAGDADIDLYSLIAARLPVELPVDA